MELVLCARHQVAGNRKEHQLINEWLFQVDLDVLVRKDSLALNKQSTYLRLPDDIPPVFAILYYVLDHLVVVAFEFVVFLVSQQFQILNPIVESKYTEIFVYLL